MADDDNADGDTFPSPQVNLAPKTPLPPPTPAGEWRLDPPTNDNTSAPLPVRQETTLSTRGWSLQGPPAPARYATEPSRLRVFTEESARLDLRPHLGSYGRPLALAVTGPGREDIHVLASAPLRLFSFYGAGGDGGGGGVVRRVELIGGGWGNYLDDEPHLVPFVVAPGEERVGVVFPRKGYMVGGRLLGFWGFVFCWRLLGPLFFLQFLFTSWHPTTNTTKPKQIHTNSNRWCSTPTAGTATDGPAPSTCPPSHPLPLPPLMARHPPPIRGAPPPLAGACWWGLGAAVGGARGEWGRGWKEMMDGGW
jgi:hypothetical protein